MSVSNRNKPSHLNKSVAYSPRTNTAFSPQLSERTSQGKQGRVIRSKSLKFSSGLHSKRQQKHLQDKSSKMIKDIVREAYSYQNSRNRTIIFKLPEQVERMKMLSEERSQQIKMNRICRECTHPSSQTCQLPTIAKRNAKPAEMNNRKKRHTTMKINKRIRTNHQYQRLQQDDENQDELRLPDNSKLHGRISQQRFSRASSKRNDSMTEQSVNIVYECEQEQEQQADNTLASGDEQSNTFLFKSEGQMASNNPLTTTTIYYKNRSKAFYNRYYPQNTDQNLLRQLNSQFIKLQPNMNTEQFIRRYVPRTEGMVKINQLILSPLFQIDFVQTREPLSLYFGEKNYGVRHGLGVYVEQDLIKQGRWERDQFVEGVLQNSEYFYKGQFYQGGRYGHGKCNWKAGPVYVGDWELDEMHGNGFWFDNSSKINYLGDWQFSRPQGLGVIKRKGFSSYEGEILNWRPHGRGKQIFQNSQIYQGIFYKGLPDGEGEYLWKNRSQFTGNFENGARKGLGRFEAPGILKFQGQYKEDLPNGDGRITYVNTDQYKGELQNGLRQGEGTLTCKGKKKIFQGIWQNDELKMA